MCLVDVTELTQRMAVPRVLTPQERVEAVLMASHLDGGAELCNRAEQPELLKIIANSAALLRRLAS